MTRPGIRKGLEAMQALFVSVILPEHSFRDNPRNTQCSNATEISYFTVTSGLQRIAGRAISVKLHPQEVLAAKLGTQYACSKRSEIDSN